MAQNLRLRGAARLPSGDGPENFLHGHPELILNGNYLPQNFRQQSKQIAQDVIHFVCLPDGQQSDRAPNRPCQIMRSLVQDTINASKDMFEDFVERLDLHALDKAKTVQEITTHMFSDEVVSWGRIVTLFAFCAYFAKHLEQLNQPGSAEVVAAALADITINRLGLWIVANGDWKSFDSQFPAICWLEYAGFWKGIAITVVLIIIILFFFVIVRFINW